MRPLSRSSILRWLRQGRAQVIRCALCFARGLLRILPTSRSPMLYPRAPGEIVRPNINPYRGHEHKNADPKQRRMMNSPPVTPRHASASRASDVIFFVHRRCIPLQLSTIDLSTTGRHRPFKPAGRRSPVRTWAKLLARNQMTQTFDPGSPPLYFYPAPLDRHPGF